MHSMYNADVVTSDFPRMGTDLPFLDVSAVAFPEPGVRPTRTLQRDPAGRFTRKVTREATEVGPLARDHARNRDNEQLINHVLTNPCHTTGGMVCNGR